MVDDWEQFKVRLDSDLKRLVDADTRTNKELTHVALWREFGGERQAALDIQIEHKEEREEMVRSQIKDLQEELQQILEEKEALLSKKEKMQEEQNAYEEHLEELEEFLLQGRHLDPTNPRVKNAASIGDVDPTEVIKELKERNPDVPDHAFVDGLHADESWNGFENGGSQ